MAIQRVTSNVNIQPTQTTSDPLSAAQQATSRQQASSFASVEQAASQVGQIATSYLRDYALKQAQDDAAGIVEYDNDGNLLVPKNFDAPIGAGLLYSQTYTRAAEANYKHAAINEFQGQAAKLQAQFPTDPEAFSAKLIEYRDAKIAAMPPAMRPLMTAHFETIRSQGATSIGAARQRIVNETTMRNADDLKAQWVEDWAAYTRSKGSGNYDPAALDQHGLKLEDRWNDFVAMARQSGVPDVAIQRYRKVAEAQADARNFFSGIEASVGSAGESASSVFGAQQDRIKEFEKKYPGAEFQQIIAAEKQAAMARANARSSGTVNAQNVLADGYNAQKADILRRQSEARAAVSANPGDYPDQEAAYREINRQFGAELAALSTKAAMDTNLRPLQSATIGLSTLEAKDASQHQYVSTALASQVSVLQNVKSTPLEKSMALADIETFARQPEVIAYGLSSPQGAALVRSAQNVVGQAHMTAAMGDIATLQEKLSGGFIDPQQVETSVAHARRQNWIGTEHQGQITPSAMRDLIVRNNQKWGERQQSEIEVARSLINVRNGGFNSSEQLQAISKVRPFTMSARDPITGIDKSVPPDFNRPQDVQNVLGYINSTLAIPESLQKYLSNVTRTADPKQRQHMLSIFQSIRDTFDNHLSAGGAPIQERNKLVSAQLNMQLGDTYRGMTIVAKLGPEATLAQINRELETQNSQRENPDKASETARLVDERLTRITKMGVGGLLDDIYYGAGEALLNNPLTRLAYGGEQAILKWGFMSEKATASLVSSIAGRSALSTTYIQSKPIEIDGTVRSHIIGHTQAYKDTNGGSDRKNNLDPDEQGILDYLMRDKSLAFEEVRNADGIVEKYRLVRSPFFAEANKSAGTNLNQSQWNDMLSLVARVKAPHHFQDAGQGAVDPASVNVQHVERDDGTVLYGLYGRNHKAGTTVYLGDIRPDDPALAFSQARIYQAVADEMNNSKLASFLSNFPIIGSLLERNMADNIKTSLLEQEGQRNMTSKEYANFLLTLRDSLRMGPEPISQFADPRYDEEWKKLETAAAQRAIARYGGLGFILGLTSKQPLGFTMPSSPIDSDPAGSWQDNASPLQQQGMRDAADALERARSRNRGSRKPEGQK